MNVKLRLVLKTQRMLERNELRQECCRTITFCERLRCRYGCRQRLGINHDDIERATLVMTVDRYEKMMQSEKIR
ncbi:hypothetical protein [Paenibacillus sp. ACRRX]|uniref:hypothetical protein n=1 Tax=Paenibacillus sp. ACRRX TaxID=2918206 RepID=UPI001EF68FFF|nr:hypothetical protein [Paenibacillus sp. ACRRX]